MERCENAEGRPSWHSVITWSVIASPHFIITVQIDSFEFWLALWEGEADRSVGRGLTETIATVLVDAAD